MQAITSFPTDQKVILLTAQAAGDPQLIDKISKQLQGGGDVVITTGLLNLEQDRLADIVDLLSDEVIKSVTEPGAATGFWGRREAPEAKFKLTILPHSYKAFKY